MAANGKAQETLEKSILCYSENADICKPSERKKSSRKKSSDISGAEKSPNAVSIQRCEIASKKRKLCNGSPISFATGKGNVHCGVKEDLTCTLNARYVENSSSSSPLKKTRKTRYQKDASENAAAVNLNTASDVSTVRCEEQPVKRKKKSKGDKHSVLRSPLFADSDLAERIVESQKVRDKCAETCMDVTIEKTSLEVFSLNCEVAETDWTAPSHEAADVSKLDDLRRHEEESSFENNSKKSRKIIGDRNGKKAKSKSTVDVKLSVTRKLSKTSSENRTKKTSRTEEEFVAEDSKSSVNTLADNPSADRHHSTKTKRKTNADGSHVVTTTTLLSEDPQRSSPTQQLCPRLIGTCCRKPAALNACVPRPNRDLFRRKMVCPVEGCLGRSTRIHRHILDCHPELDASEREKLAQKTLENPCDFLSAVPLAPVVPILKRRLRCPVDGCFTKTVRLRRHLVNVHSDLMPTERDELWVKVSQNPTDYVHVQSDEPSTSVNKEEEEVRRRLKKTSAGIPRPNFKVHSRRSKQICPVVGCHGAAINMRRHLVDCHSDIADEHEQLLEKVLGQRRKERAAKKNALKVKTERPDIFESTDCVLSKVKSEDH